MGLGFSHLGETSVASNASQQLLSSSGQFADLFGGILPYMYPGMNALYSLNPDQFVPQNILPGTLQFHYLFVGCFGMLHLTGGWGAMQFLIKTSFLLLNYFESTHSSSVDNM